MIPTVTSSCSGASDLGVISTMTALTGGIAMDEDVCSAGSADRKYQTAGRLIYLTAIPSNLPPLKMDQNGKQLEMLNKNY